MMAVGVGEKDEVKGRFGGLIKRLRDGEGEKVEGVRGD